MIKDYRWDKLTDLKCDVCGKLMGKIFEMDLNGTLILCFECGKP